MSIRRFTAEDAAWFQYRDRQIYVGDVLDSSNSDTMSVGFYRNTIKGERNEWIVTYDEALVVTRGALTVRSGEGAVTAKVGEVIFLTQGTKVAYEAAEDGTEFVYVTYPHWMDAQRQSEHAHMLDAYRPVDERMPDRARGATT